MQNADYRTRDERLEQEFAEIKQRLAVLELMQSETTHALVEVHEMIGRWIKKTE